MDRAGHVAGGPADGLDQRGARPEEALLVGVQDRHQRHLGQVETLAQQVDADEHVELAHPQLAEQLDPAQRVDLGVEVAHADAELEEVVGEVLRHLLRERGDKHPLVALGPLADLVHEVVDLALRGLHHDLRVDQPGRPDDLLDRARAAAELVRTRRRREVDGLADPVDELLPAQRSVVHRRRQPEPVLDQRPLARHVALVHAADLRHRHVRLVDHEEEVLGEVVEQAVRRAACGPPVDVPRVVLDAGAEADLAHHLDVVGRAHAQPLRLEQLAGALERGELRLELGLDAGDRPVEALLAGHVVRGRRDEQLLVLADDLAGHRVEHEEALDLVAEHLDPDRVLLVHRDDLDRVAPAPGTCRG